MSLVSIGLVTWNSAAHLPACLDALAAQSHPQIELIVVDNASADDSAGRAAALFPAARVIRNAANRGYAGAHNQAIAASRGEFYLALNPDVVMTPDYLSRLAAALAERPAYGAAGGKLLQAPGRLDGAGLFIDRRRRQILRGHGALDNGQYDTAEEVFGLDGAAPLYRRTMLAEAAFENQVFDEAFFAYKEDVDLAWRARLLGWRTWYEPAAQAEHSRTFRPGRRERGSVLTRRLSVRNRYLLLLKNEVRAAWRRDWPAILAYDAQILAYLLVREQASLAGVVEAWRLRPVMRRWRADLQRRRRVTDAECLAWFH